jgi:hypothetical protein
MKSRGVIFNAPFSYNLVGAFANVLIVEGVSLAHTAFEAWCWRAREDSNLRHTDSKSDALSTELRAHDPIIAKTCAIDEKNITHTPSK